MMAMRRGMFSSGNATRIYRKPAAGRRREADCHFVATIDHYFAIAPSAARRDRRVKCHHG
jgi:hypothetical protein